MSVRQGTPANVEAMLQESVSSVVPHDPLAEGNSYTTVNPEHPLERDICVSIKSSLSDLCLQQNKATWKPTQEALRSMFQQRKVGASTSTLPSRCFQLCSLRPSEAARVRG